MVEPQRMTDKDDDRPTRRDYLGLCAHGSLGMGAAAIVWPVARYLSPPDTPSSPETPATVAVCENHALTRKQAHFARYRNRPVVVLRLDDGSLRAFDATCPHLGCTVRLDPDRNTLRCPCHGAEFDPATGAPERGPAVHPLLPLIVQVRHDTIVVGT